MSWIDDNKDEGPWDSDHWQSDKDLGSWSFSAQPDKPHYNEGNLISDHDNPVWGTDHSGVPATPTHHPWCGYWTGELESELIPEEIIDANIYILNWSDSPTLYGVHFDGSKLSWGGVYQSVEDINGLCLYDNELLTVAGDGPTAIFRRISTNVNRDGFLFLISSHNGFNDYDVRYATNGRLLNIGNNEVYYADSTSVMVSTDNLIRDKRGFRHTVITGTDGNLYVVHSTHTWWEPDWHPITGPQWSTFWHLVEDNICDTVLGSWGVNPLIHDGSVEIDIIYYKDRIYTVDFSSRMSPIKKINPMSLETEDSYTGIYYLNRIAAYGDKIYAIGGMTNITVYSFDADTLSLLNSNTLPDGRAPDGDLEIVGNYLIVSATSYATLNATLYKLDLNSLEILDSISSLGAIDHIGPQRLEKINDNFVAAAWNNGIKVFSINPLVIVDDLISMEYYDNMGYHAQAMVVKHNQREI